MRSYILGAGASLHAGCPLMKSLGHKLVNWATTKPDLKQNEFIEPAYEVLVDWRDGNKLNNLEYLLTECDSGKMGIESWPIVRAGIAILLAEFLKAIPQKPAIAYKGFANIIAPGDVIATFNYDTALEIELGRAGKWHPRDGYGFDISSGETKSDVILLKLHGSVNWQASVMNGQTSGLICMGGPTLDQRPMLSPSDCNALGFPNYSDPCYKGGGQVSYMILPSYDKKYYYSTSYGEECKPFWDCLWKQTRNAVTCSDEVMLIGYSLPAADHRACKLLFDSIPYSTRIMVCAGNESQQIAERFRAKGHTDVEVVEKSFESWIEKVANKGGSVAEAGKLISN